jgi:hypothetical protein
MGISQPEVSRLFKGTFREYSVDRLVSFLTAFDRDVEIVSRPRKQGRAGTRGRISFRPLSPKARIAGRGDRMWDKHGACAPSPPSGQGDIAETIDNVKTRGGQRRASARHGS